MILKTTYSAVIIFFLLPIVSHADTEIITRHVPEAQIVGTTRLNFLFWNVYDATLYAPDANWLPSSPYALAISYLRELKGNEIAKRSVKEMRELGFTDEDTLEDWYQQMANIFPDVDENTTLIGIRKRNGQTVFYDNGRLAGTVSDTRFADWFFGIWLNEKSSEPKLRRELLGLPE